MLISVEQNRMGDLTLRPVSDKWQRRIVKHLRAMKAIPIPEEGDTSVWAESCLDGSVYVQSNVDEFIANDIPPRHRKAVREGWTVRFRMDTWTYLTMVGYDAAEVL